MNVSKRTLCSSLLSAAIACLSVGSGARAQTGTVIPIPFVTSVAGLAAGSGNTACTTGLANQSGQALGDGCLPTQATLLTLYDVQTDASGNIYISENGTNNDIRMIYNGGTAAAALLTAANAGISGFTPVVGRIYTLAGGTASALTATNKVYYCGNVSTAQHALDSQGNGCPAAQSYLKPRGMAVDRFGNVFATNTGGGNGVRVIYAGGTQVANLITLENPGVTPVVGAIYKLSGTSTAGYSGDGQLASAASFVSVRYIAVDSNGNLYISDGTTQSTSGGKTIEAAANNVREINGTTGIITTFAGETSCTYVSTTGCSFGSTGDGGPATSALLSTPYALFVDGSNNVYIADYYNGKIRVVYQGGTIAGITNPAAGYIYTYAGGGSSTANGTAATSVSFGTLYVAGIDRAGNIYAEDGTSKVIWRFDAKTAIGDILAGGKSTTAVAMKGAFCSGTSGPVSTDSYGDGCPGPQTTLSDTGTIAFDPFGNFYTAENGNGIVREYSYNNLFPATADGTTATQPLAFETLSAATLNGESFTLQGSTTAEYADGGNATCALNASLTASQVCVFNVAFNPAHAGQRQGSLRVTTSLSTTPAAIEDVSGTGLAADLAIDTGTRSTLGSGLTPGGVATDLLGNVYVSDSKGNQVLKGASTGTALTSLGISGLNRPAGVAVDGQGNLYIADTGNNRVLETTSAGAQVAVLGSGLAAPQGVAVDGLGDIYVADTGNNRVLQVSANGTQAALPVTGLSAPTEIMLDSAGDLFILDAGNKRIVEYGVAGQTVVGLDAGVTPAGVAVDPAGTVYVADSAGLRILAYPAGATTGDLLLSGLTSPTGLAADADANLFVADTGAGGAVELRRSLGNITFPLTNVGQTTTASISVSNAGNAALSFPSAPLTTISGGNGLYTVASANSNGCAVGTAYAAGAGCNFTASFTPTATGSSSASVYFNTNATNAGTAHALLAGTGLLLTSTNTALTIQSPTGSIYYNQAVTLAATLTSSTTTTTPTGNFTFTIDGKTQSPQAIGSGMVTLKLTTLAAGSHTVSVTYSGDGTYASSNGTVTFMVNKAVTTTLLTETPVNTSGALSLVFTANVSSTTASGEGGTVTFYAGGTPIGSPVAISSTGTATVSTTSLSFAANSFTAVYSGDPNFAGSTSAALSSAGDFILGYSSTAVSTSQGGVASISFAVAPLFGATGTVTPSCTGLPANTVCRFQPTTLTLGSTQQTESVEIYTNVASNLALNHAPGLKREVLLALGLPLGLGLLFLRRRRVIGALAVVLLGAMSLGMGGCGNGTSSSTSQTVTPAGVYTVTVVFTGSNGLTATHSVPVSFTVLGNTTGF